MVSKEPPLKTHPYPLSAGPAKYCKFGLYSYRGCESKKDPPRQAPSTREQTRRLRHCETAFQVKSKQSQDLDCFAFRHPRRRIRRSAGRTLAMTERSYPISFSALPKEVKSAARSHGQSTSSRLRYRENQATQNASSQLQSTE